MKNNLRVILAIKKMKISALSIATGVSRNTLTALFYERIKEPKVTTLIKIADYLGCTVDDLIRDDGGEYYGR